MITKLGMEALKSLVIIFILTVLTQIGGLVYLLYKPVSIQIKRRVSNKLGRITLRMLTFSGMMIFSSLLIVPPMAKMMGRVNLPVRASAGIPLKPANLVLVFANRHYVTPELRDLIIDVSKHMAQAYPGTTINYLDASFPFIAGFPLLPHRSHDDGKKLDIGFLYKDATNGDRINRSPTLFGYGHSEAPAAGEFDQISACESSGYWQYDLLSKLTFSKQRFAFDAPANTALIQRIIRDQRTRRIFIEPHLKTRLGFSGASKVRFHGCQAVRHDDHIHLEHL